MNCQKCQQTIMTGTDTAARHAHLRECPACQAFARAHEALLLTGSAIEPSPALDAAVRRLARERLAFRPAGRIPFGWRRLAGHYRLLAAAAVLMLSFGLIMIYRQAADIPATPPPVAVLPVQINWGDDGLEDSLQSLDQTIRDFSRNPIGLPTATGRRETSQAPSLERILQETELDLYFELNDDVWNVPTSQLQPTPKPRSIA